MANLYIKQDFSPNKGDRMVFTVDVRSKIDDKRAEVLREKLRKEGIPVDEVQIVDNYTIDYTEGSDDQIHPEDIETVAGFLTDPVTEESSINQSPHPDEFDYAIQIGFKPGVTDNVGHTAKEVITDYLPGDMDVYTSQTIFLSGQGLQERDAKEVGYKLANPLIQNIKVKGEEMFRIDKGMGINRPVVEIDEKPTADIVNLLEASDEELTLIGKKGLANLDGTRRGPLAMDLNYMKAVHSYFEKEGRNPTDVEVESLAQTWSEHCKHTTFANQMDDIEDGIFSRYIKGATDRIRELKGKDDFCISVFKDNSGGIEFDEDHIISHKVETHNSPSALDPFGGAITGIVGVNRDTMGFGLGAKPVINIYGFCFGNPDDERELFKGPDFTQMMLSPKRIMEGVVEGVNVGGNCSGIPTPQGFTIFDDRYRGKPLVYVGTVGLMPKESAGRLSHEKKAQPGDFVVMAGGRVGKDGVHGATFSSEPMDTGSPATAVQIGDPITQKKMSDALVKEARDLGLYNSITDNGAGGISCSVAEMAEECGGCHVQLDSVPTKYAGIKPWEIWISESQERMTLSVPPGKWAEFNDLMQRRGVEATVIGKFEDSGKCVVEYGGEKVMDVDMEFLHNGLPSEKLHTKEPQRETYEPVLDEPEDHNDTFHTMLRRPNMSSWEFISQQFDHEVQGGSVIKPLQGAGGVNGDASVTRPLLSSQKAVVLSQALNPSYSEINPYDMAAAAIDTAVRNAVAAGANPDKIAILDNFCWCSSNEPERLWQLKKAAEACYDTAVAYGTPFISGKDSMFNDFKGYDENGEPVKISVPPTLLISSMSVMDDAKKAIPLDAKYGTDLVYVIGETNDEMGGSEYFAMRGKGLGTTTPKVDTEKNMKAYKALHNAMEQDLVESAQSVHRGGLIMALAKTSMGGKLGMDLYLKNLPGNYSRDDFALYSESQGRIVVTVEEEKQEEFEKAMEGVTYGMIGEVTGDSGFTIENSQREEIIRTDTDTMLENYRATLGGF